MKILWKKDETINHMIKRSSKQAQKEYKSMHNLEDKLIYLELCKMVYAQTRNCP